MDDFAYYSLDDILADAELIPVIMMTDAIDLGFLDEQSVDEPVLLADTRVEVPLWLATQLALRQYVTLELPRVFQPAFREMLLADPCVVDLQAKCAYFYEFGIKIATLISEADLGNTLCRAMNARYLEIVKRTANRKQSESLDFVSRLANMERQLFDSKEAGILQTRKLHDRSSVQLSIAPVLAALQSCANTAASTHAQGQHAHGGVAAASTAERRAAGGNPNALRNITNAQQGTRTAAASAAAHAAALSDRRAHPSVPTKAAKAASSSTPMSTLAHLTALNASNQPLASHQQKRYGMAATQQREQRQQQRESAFMADTAAATQHQSIMPTAQSARKRKITQNK